MKPKNSGFTLIEVLLALGLSALMLGAIYSLLYTGSRGWKYMRGRADVDETARVVLDRLERDLENAVPLSKGQWSGKFPFHGESSTLSFPTLLSIVDPEADQPPFEQSAIGFVTYRWGPSAEGATNVLERDWVLLTPDADSSLPASGKDIFPSCLTGIAFSYAYRGGSSVAWDALWREPEKIPQGVRVDLTLTTPEKGDSVVLSKTIQVLNGALGNARWLVHASS